MKRAEIEKLFDGKVADGIDVKELVDAILAQNGKDVNLAKETAQKLNAEEIENIKAEAVKPYLQGGENYIDRNAVKQMEERINWFLERDKKQAQEKSISELLQNGKFDGKATRLLQKAIYDYEPKFNEENKIENGEDILQKMIADYADFVVKESSGGFNPAPPQPTPPIQEDGFTAGFKKELQI